MSPFLAIKYQPGLPSHFGITTETQAPFRWSFLEQQDKVLPWPPNKRQMTQQGQISRPSPPLMLGTITHVMTSFMVNWAACIKKFVVQLYLLVDFVVVVWRLEKNTAFCWEHSERAFLVSWREDTALVKWEQRVHMFWCGGGEGGVLSQVPDWLLPQHCWLLTSICLMITQPIPFAGLPFDTEEDIQDLKREYYYSYYLN